MCSCGAEGSLCLHVTQKPEKRKAYCIFLILLNNFRRKQSSKPNSRISVFPALQMGGQPGCSSRAQLKQLDFQKLFCLAFHQNKFCCTDPWELHQHWVYGGNVLTQAFWLWKPAPFRTGGSSPWRSSGGWIATEAGVIHSLSKTFGKVMISIVFIWVT